MPLTSIEDRFSRAPTVNDDILDGYQESWFWEDQSNNDLYKCATNTAGSATWILIAKGSGSVPLVTTGVQSPTTSTVGKVMNIRVDTAGNRWELKKIEGATYYWSPDGFPADNTEYPAYVENGVMIWKIRVPGVSGANVNVSFSSPAVGSKKILKTDGGLWLASGGFCTFPIYSYATTFQFTVAFNLNDVAGIMSYTIWTGYGGSFHNRPMFADFYFTK